MYNKKGIEFSKILKFETSKNHSKKFDTTSLPKTETIFFDNVFYYKNFVEC